jgi:hypothetical protein
MANSSNPYPSLAISLGRSLPADGFRDGCRWRIVDVLSKVGAMAELRPESWLPQASAGESAGGGPGREPGASEPPESEPDRGNAEPAAPSIGPRTQLDHTPPEERLAGHEHSQVDAMGLDKYREVRGKTYGPTRTRVIMRFVVFFAVVGAIFVGLLFVVDQVDQPPESNPDKAPWTASDREPKPLQ